MKQTIFRVSIMLATFSLGIITSLIWPYNYNQVNNLPESVFKTTENIDSFNNKPTNLEFVNQCGIEFYLPSNFKLEGDDSSSYDSCEKSYKSENARMSLRILRIKPIPKAKSLSKVLSNQEGFKLEKTVIEGQQAEIGTFLRRSPFYPNININYSVYLEIPQISLTMAANCKSPEEREMMIKIFKSVHLVKIN